MRSVCHGLVEWAVEQCGLWKPHAAIWKFEKRRQGLKGREGLVKGQINIQSSTVAHHQVNVGKVAASFPADALRIQPVDDLPPYGQCFPFKVSLTQYLFFIFVVRRWGLNTTYKTSRCF